MNCSVDLTNLRAMIDNDRALEKELFEEFYLSAEEMLNILEQNLNEAGLETWRQQAHALKGIALNLGAIQLGECAKQAQDNYTATMENKQRYLSELKNEYSKTKQYLKQL